MKIIQLVRISSARTFRPFHWMPRVYDGVNGVHTKLLVVGWLAIEYWDCYPYCDLTLPR